MVQAILLCELQQPKSSSNNESLLKRASETLAKAWTECIAAPGLKASLQLRSDPRSFVFHAKWNAFGEIAQTEVVDFHSLPEDGITCSARPAPGEVLSSYGIQVPCRRSDATQGFELTLRTKRGTQSVFVDPVFPPPAKPACDFNVVPVDPTEEFADCADQRVSQIKKDCQDQADGLPCAHQRQTWENLALAARQYLGATKRCGTHDCDDVRAARFQYGEAIKRLQSKPQRGGRTF